LVVGHVDNPLQKRIYKRQIATLHTLITAQEKELAKAALKG
jgi:ribosomal protein L29